MPPIYLAAITVFTHFYRSNTLVFFAAALSGVNSSASFNFKINLQ